MRIAETEAQLQANVKAFLDYALPADALYFAVPNGAHSNGRHVKELKRQGLRPGVADLIIVFRGKTIGCELKSRKGRQRPEQMEFARKLVEAGGSYYIARTVTEVALILDAEGIGAKARLAA